MNLEVVITTYQFVITNFIIRQLVSVKRLLIYMIV